MKFENDIKSIPAVKFFVNNGSNEMNINGSKEVPYKFTIKPENEEQILYITSIYLHITSSYAPDLGNFCGLDALLNGLKIQVTVNNKNLVFTNWKTYNEMKLDVDSRDINIDFSDNLYTTRILIRFGGHCSTIKLDGANNDSFDIYVQDDLRELSSFMIRANTHEEEKLCHST